MKMLLVCLLVALVHAEGDAPLPAPSVTDAVNQIQCDVCKGSVKHTWREAVKLKEYCLHHRDESKGCSRSSTSRQAVLDIMEKSCKFIINHMRIVRSDAKSYALETVHDETEATPEAWQKTAIEKACHHGMLQNREGDRFERTLHANIEAGKTEKIILPGLNNVICKAACDAATTFNDEM